MAIHVLSRKVDPQLKVEVVVFADDFGSQHIVQHPLLDDNHDVEAFESAEVSAHAEREKRFEAALIKRGHNPANFKVRNDAPTVMVNPAVATEPPLENCEGCGDQG